MEIIQKYSDFVFCFYPLPIFVLRIIIKSSNSSCRSKIMSSRTTDCINEFKGVFIGNNAEQQKFSGSKDGIILKQDIHFVLHFC